MLRITNMEKIKTFIIATETQRTLSKTQRNITLNINKIKYKININYK